jgi:hypothetical protein
MSVAGVLFSKRLFWLWSLLMVWWLMPQALAQDVSITALFKPDSGLSAHQPIQEHHAAQWLLSVVSRAM